MDASALDRYRTLVDDWDAFSVACERPLPIVIRTNTLRTDPARLERRLRAAGIGVTSIPWDEALFAVDRPVGNLIEHWLGLFYVQEAVQTLPVRMLDPQPHETILDLCSAPGGKATQIAARMRNTGTLVANEPSGRRQQALLANVNRLGVLNTLLPRYRGESFPMQAAFDRILVDAPCSAEGTLRKERSLRSGAARHAIERLARLQKRLIVRAFDLLRPGGVLVYSTCTFAPEENEAVVAHLLDRRSASIRPIDPPFQAAAGTIAWGGERFPDPVAGCLRVYPHHLDSGGGFVARIERS